LKWPVVSPFLHVYFRLKIYGAEHVPKTGGVVVVSNHASYLDPPLLSNCLGRPVAFMAKQELFKVPGLKQFMEVYGAYSVNRGGSDRSAIRAALDVLDRGWATGVFLEGTRTQDGKVNNPKQGAVLIATKAHVPLLPVSLYGTEKVFRGGAFPKPSPITVRIGEPIPVPEKADKQTMKDLTLQCQQTINSLHDLGR
jgi:1-acyl-sn-glycerol-3-phosphate acyltransferase